MDLSAPIYFNDKDVKIRQSGITIKGYYFPIGTSKRISFSDIRDIRIIDQKVGRIWGTDQHQYWFPFDSKRIKRDSFIVIDNGQSMKPAFTCTDNQKAFEILKKLLSEKRKQICNKIDGTIQK